MPEVSVIIPCYNQAQYLPNALGSVLAQSFPDWEVVIVDDGSTDKTAEISKAILDNRIRLIRQENKGLAAARNNGIQAAEGSYLAFLDADDRWQPQFITRCLEVLRLNPELAGVYTGHYFIDDADKILPQVVYGQGLSQTKMYVKLWEGGFFPPCTTMIRKNAVCEAGLFDVNLQGHGCEDWDLWLRIVKDYRLGSVAEPLAEYRIYPGSMSTNTEQMHENRLAILDKNFGGKDGTVPWSKEKRRAYAFAYRSTAIGYLLQMQPDKAWEWLNKGAHIWPPILDRLDTFYEFALGDQQLGYRGTAENLNIHNNGVDLLQHLRIMMAGAMPEVKAMRRRAFGNAYLALVMLHDQTRQWASARYYLRQAFLSNPRLIISRSNIRRFLKLSARKPLSRLVSRSRLDSSSTRKMSSKTH